MKFPLLAMFIGLSLPLAPGAAETHGAGMDMGDMHQEDPMLFMLKADEFEARDSRSGVALEWDVDAWLGRDLHKAWLKIEGEHDDGNLDELETQLLYSRAIAAYWDLQAGWRHDAGPDPDRDWFAIGFRGIAPYWFEVDSAVYIGESGRMAFSLEAEYELLITQRLVLTPELELTVYSEDDPRRGLGSGLAELETGLRLRYEIRREFAPYVGLTWKRHFGETEDLARAEGEPVDDLQAVIGIRFWF